MDRMAIRLMGGFLITVRHNGEYARDIPGIKSRKKISLLTYLIMHSGKPVVTQRLIREMWSAKQMVSPASSLKTTISRLRAYLNEALPGAGECIRSEKSSYWWQPQENVSVDVLEILKQLSMLRKLSTDAEKQACWERLLLLYEGDLYLTGDILNGEQFASLLHREYLEAMYAYIAYLRERECYNEIVRVAKKALQIDELDEYLRIELMRAMVSLNRSSDAAAEYRKVSSLHRKLLDEEPGEDLSAGYKALAETGTALQFNLDAIRNELMERESEKHGPFFCDYAAFKEIYNVQMRNLERLGSTMFLGVIMVDSTEEDGNEFADVRRESAMAGLQEIMRLHLRKGDIVTRFSPSIYAMLLPTVNYATGSMVMERMEQLFYEEYPSRKVAIYHRISPLGAGVDTVPAKTS